MFTAIDLSGEEVFIGDADPTKVYFCKVCQQKLMQKRKGEGRAPHFSHYGTRTVGYIQCSDHWKYDKTEWHLNWQREFPQMEVIVERAGKKHIADVLVHNTVIEFQHSHISKEEFLERNNFYKNAGYRVIWVFDMILQVERSSFHKDIWGKDEYVWTNVKKAFRGLSFEDLQCDLFFQIHEEDSRNNPILELVLGTENGFGRVKTNSNKMLSRAEFVELALENKLEEFIDAAYTCDEEKKQDVQSFANSNSTQNVNVKPAEQVEGGSTIWELWNPNYKSMVVLNCIDKQTMFLWGEGGRLAMNWKGCVVGKYTSVSYNNTYRYSDIAYPIKRAGDPIWKKIYSKTREKESTVEEKIVKIAETEKPKETAQSMQDITQEEKEREAVKKAKAKQQREEAFFDKRPKTKFLVGELKKYKHIKSRMLSAQGEGGIKKPRFFDVGISKVEMDVKRNTVIIHGNEGSKGYFFVQELTNDRADLVRTGGLYMNIDIRNVLVDDLVSYLAEQGIVLS